MYMKALLCVTIVECLLESLWEIAIKKINMYKHKKKRKKNSWINAK